MGREVGKKCDGWGDDTSINHTYPPLSECGVPGIAGPAPLPDRREH
jgi:hypothetical protein